MKTPPDPADVAAVRLVEARPGPGRRRIVSILVAQIGSRVPASPPAAGSEARWRWEDLRRAELRRQIDLISVLRPRG
jgi:hypothetical protein